MNNVVDAIQTHRPFIHSAGRLLAATALLAVGFVALAFVFFLIALSDVGRVVNAWALFFLVLFVAMGLRLAAWALRRDTPSVGPRWRGRSRGSGR